VTMSAGAVRALLERHGLEPRRSMGQNFMVDRNTIERIAAESHVGPGDRVVEIGPGLGALTTALAGTGADITAIEADRAILPVLDDVLNTAGVADRVRVIHADAATVDWSDVIGDAPCHLVANLPYNIATGLVCDMLADVAQIMTMTVLVQAEVAERMTAHPHTRQIGAVTLKVAHRADARIVMRVPPTVFVPRPRVDSAVVHLVRHHRQPADVDEAVLWDLVRTAYAQRRKMLRRSLAGVADITTIGAAGIDPTARPEHLNLDAWYCLAREVAR